MILTKILLDFWDSPENILFQKNNFYILFHDIFKKGWFIIWFVSTFGIYRDFKWKWIKIEESPHIPWVFNQFFRKVRFLKVIQLNPGQIEVNQKIIKGGANGAKKKCSLTKNRNKTGSNLSLGTRLTVLSKRLGRKRCCDATPDRCLGGVPSHYLRFALWKNAASSSERSRVWAGSQGLKRTK